MKLFKSFTAHLPEEKIDVVVNRWLFDMQNNGQNIEILNFSAHFFANSNTRGSEHVYIIYKTDNMNKLRNMRERLSEEKEIS